MGKKIQKQTFPLKIEKGPLANVFNKNEHTSFLLLIWALSASFGEKYNRRSLVDIVSSVGRADSFLEVACGITFCTGGTSVRTLSLSRVDIGFLDFLCTILLRCVVVVKSFASIFSSSLSELFSNTPGGRLLYNGIRGKSTNGLVLGGGTGGIWLCVCRLRTVACPLSQSVAELAELELSGLRGSNFPSLCMYKFLIRVWCAKDKAIVWFSGCMTTGGLGVNAASDSPPPGRGIVLHFLVLLSTVTLVSAGFAVRPSGSPRRRT